MTPLKLEISAENMTQARAILDVLLAAKLATGGQFLQSPARFLWKGNITDMDYVTLTSFTLSKHQQAIIDSVRATSQEEVPMVTFTPFAGNPELLHWIEETVG